MEVPSPWDSPPTWVKATALPGRSRHSPGTSMVSTPSWGHLTVALVCIAQSGTLTTREHIKCPSTNHSKRTRGSSKLAGLGTAGGPTTAVPTQARRAAECWGAAWGASCPCAHRKLHRLSHFPLPAPAELPPCRERSTESRHPQDRDMGECALRLKSQTWEPAPPAAAGSSAPSQRAGMDLSQRSPWGGEPNGALARTASGLERSLSSGYWLLHPYNSTVTRKVSWL